MFRLAKTSRPSVFGSNGAPVFRDVLRPFATTAAASSSKSTVSRQKSEAQTTSIPISIRTGPEEGSHLRTVKPEVIDGRPVLRVRVRPAPGIKRTRFREWIARFCRWAIGDKLRKNLREEAKNARDPETGVATFSLRRLSLSLDKLLDSNRPLLGPAPSLHRLTKAVGEDFVQKLGTWVAPYAKRDLPLHRLRQLSLLASNAHMLPSKNRPIIIVKGRTRKTFRRTVPRPVPSRIFKKALAGAMKQLQSQGTPVKKLTKPRLVRFRRYFEPVYVDSEGNPTGVVQPVHYLQFLAGPQATPEERDAIQAEIFYQSVESARSRIKKPRKIRGIPSRQERREKLRALFSKRVTPAAAEDTEPAASKAVQATSETVNALQIAHSLLRFLQRSKRLPAELPANPELDRLVEEFAKRVESQALAFEEAGGDLSKLPTDHPAHKLMPLLQAAETADAAFEKARSMLGDLSDEQLEAKMKELLKEPDMERVFSSLPVPGAELSKELVFETRLKGVEHLAATSLLKPTTSPTTASVAAAVDTILKELPKDAKALEKPTFTLAGAIDRLKFLGIALRSNTLSSFFKPSTGSPSELVSSALLMRPVKVNRKELELSKMFFNRDRFLYNSWNEVKALKDPEEIRDAIHSGAVAPHVLKQRLASLAHHLRLANKKDPAFVPKALNKILTSAWARLGSLLDYRGANQVLLESVPFLRSFLRGKMSLVDFHLSKSPDMFIAEEQFRELMDKRGASISERLRIAKSVELSRGVFTIEWALPSPPPEHTFEELPIIKELPDVAPDEKSVKPKH